ncbi:hypothetical protein N4R57_18150 [Rhodobacteraceae bacterium D3-12]|nr:hypothetical protein N4R57_18150 [Rhodobacteraceae bacterium D3-12]
MRRAFGLPWWQIAGALVVVGLGFALEMSAAGQAVGDGVALGIAVLADPILSIVGLDLVRSGVELRSLAGGWAVRVSEVCDGMGLVVALVGAVVVLAQGQERALVWGAKRLAIGIAAIQAFNLLRVVLLAGVLDRGGAGFGVLHDWVFPLLSLCVIAAALVTNSKENAGIMPRTLAVFVAIAVVLSVLWAPLAATVSAWLVPLANAALSAVAPLGVGEIAPSQAAPNTWSVGTFFVAGTEPLRLFRAPLTPFHFTVALPAIVAASLVARRVVWLVIGVPMMLVALCVAACVAALGLAAAKAPITVVLPDASGAFYIADYTRSEPLLASLRLVQNTLVHTLLLVFPVLALAGLRRQ